MKDKIFSITKKFSGKWIAVEAKTMKVVAVGESVSEVEGVLQEKQKRASYITYVVPPEYTLSPICK